MAVLAAIAVVSTTMFIFSNEYTSLDGAEPLERDRTVTARLPANAAKIESLHGHAAASELMTDDPYHENRDDEDTGHILQANDQNSDLESSIVNGNSIDTRMFLSAESAFTNFNRLLAQYRSESGTKAAKHRSTYEAIFYAQPQTSGGSVSLQALECGSKLCAATFQAFDKELIDAFLTDAQQDSRFGSRAIMQLPDSPIESNSFTRRIVFSHDTKIVGIQIQTTSSLPIE